MSESWRNSEGDFRPQRPSAGAWVKTAERLPEDFEMVVAFIYVGDGLGHIEIATYSATWRGVRQWRDRQGRNLVADPIAWLPLELSELADIAGDLNLRYNRLASPA